MNNYLKSFLHRGLIFGGFGPIVSAIVYLILSYNINDFSLSGLQVFTATVSTYLLAFVQAGASVFNQIEKWPVAKCLLCHFSMVYIAYIVCYLVNSWIPFDSTFVLVFTGIFVVIYFVIWFTVYLSVKTASKKFNEKLS